MEELLAGFATQNEELEVKYQKQVDDMFFFGYRCCMKKHGITQDTPNYISNDENTAADNPPENMETLLQLAPLVGRHDLHVFIFLGRRWLCNEHLYFSIHTCFFHFSFSYTFHFSQANLTDNIASSWTHSKDGVGTLHPMFTDGIPSSLQPQSQHRVLSNLPKVSSTFLLVMFSKTLLRTKVLVGNTGGRDFLL